jgi:hypothetical protein
MPIVVLNKKEISLLTELPLNSIAEPDVRLVFYHLNLLLDEETGTVEIPGEMWDQLREFSLYHNDARISHLILNVFSRTLGKDLSMGFFEEG